MSRTYKDKPYKYSDQFHSWEQDRYAVEYTVLQTHSYEYDPKLGRYASIELSEPIERAGVRYLQAKTSRTKKRKSEEDLEYRWMSTPSWWTRMFMNRPQRHRGRAWERKVLLCDDLEDADPPRFSNKPHIYFF